MKRLLIFSAGLLWLVSGVLPVVHGYEQIEVKNGGSITGKVILTGKIPPPPIFPTYLYPFGTYCKKIADEAGNIYVEEFNVGPHRELQDAIVAVQGVKRGKDFHEIKAEFLATDCMFHPADVATHEMYEVDEQGQARHIHPLVNVIQNHQPITVVNKDPIPHNGQVFQKERGNIMINFPLPVEPKPRGGVLHFTPGKKIAQMVCGMHEFMQTWSLVVDNPYYAKTRKDGKFIINQLPPGTYRVLVWHPRLKPIVKKVTVPPNGSVPLDFELDAGQVKRRVYETLEGSRTFK
jgi:hypothetical protein